VREYNHRWDASTACLLHSTAVGTNAACTMSINAVPMLHAAPSQCTLPRYKKYYSLAKTIHCKTRQWTKLDCPHAGLQHHSSRTSADTHVLGRCTAPQPMHSNWSPSPASLAAPLMAAPQRVEESEELRLGLHRRQGAAHGLPIADRVD
jgi:hypothetical protein